MFWGEAVFLKDLLSLKKQKISEIYSETNSTGATQRFFSQSQDKLRTKESLLFYQRTLIKDQQLVRWLKKC